MVRTGPFVLAVIVLLGLISGATAAQESPPRNLDRIDQKNFPLDGKYTYPDTAGAGVTVYVVDTGIDLRQKEFGGRASLGIVACQGCSDSDDNEHGTYLASIVAGAVHGVAKESSLVAVKVVGPSGKTSASELISGLSYVRHELRVSPALKAVVLIGISGGRDAAVNSAVRALTDAGAHVVVAAGNGGAGACDTSPASEASAITVGATEDTSDTVADFSNVGVCVDLFAPGRNIPGAGATGVLNLSGTPQAAAHVAGTIALIIAEHGNSDPAGMARTLVKFATKGVIPAYSLNESPNVFVRVPPSR